MTKERGKKNGAGANIMGEGNYRVIKREGKTAMKKGETFATGGGTYTCMTLTLNPPSRKGGFAALGREKEGKPGRRRKGSRFGTCLAEKGREIE